MATTEERREGRKLQQRQRILDAALQIIDKEGFAGLSMRKLADRIEYSPASIYLHFATREQLAQELSGAGLQELLVALTDAVAVENPIEALHRMGAAYVAYGLENPEMYRLIFMSDSDFMKAAFGNQTEESAGIRTYGALVEMAKRLRKAGVGRRTTPVELTEMIWMTLHGIVSLHITCVGLHLSKSEKQVRLATEMLAHGLNEGPAEDSSVLQGSRGSKKSAAERKGGKR